MATYGNRIVRFSIKNFRKFEKFSIGFGSDPYTVLTGRNSTGKTSILEALNICLSENSSKFNNVKESDFLSNAPIELEVEFEKPFFLSFKDGSYSRLLPCKKFCKVISRRNRKAPEQLFSSPYVIDWKFNLLEYERLSRKEYKEKWADHYRELFPKNSLVVWSLAKAKGTDEYEYTTATQEDVFGIVRAFELGSFEKILYPRVFYFDKNRDRELDNQYKTAFSNITNELDWRFRKGLAKVEAKPAIVESFDSLHKEAHAIDHYKKELLEPVVKILTDSFHLDFNIENLEFYFFDINQPYKKTIFGHKTDADKVIGISECGSGVAILTSLAFLISFADQSKEDIAILIDEPELHLHADLQKNLMEFLRSQQFQTVASTHSHLFLDQSNCRSNYLIENDKEHGTVLKCCNQIDLADVQFRLLGNSLDDLYIPEEIILVEGKYDRQIISKGLEIKGASNLPLQILACEGKDDIPNKADRYESVLSEILSGDRWFHKYVKTNLRVIFDGDVTEGKVHSIRLRKSVAFRLFNFSSVRLLYIC